MQGIKKQSRQVCQLEEKGMDRKGADKSREESGEECVRVSGQIALG